MSATRHQTLQARIEQRFPILQSLLGDFSHYVQKFAASQQFVGPSIYFHVKTIQALDRPPTTADALDDDTFFDYLYATLASWGLHRMGPGNTKLRDLDQLKDSFRAQASRIKQVQQLRIERLGTHKVHQIADAVWEIMANLRVGIGQTLLIANSKALHHLLPGLVPPIDRNYTLTFFTGRPYISRGRDANYFRAIYPLFHQIAVQCAEAERTRSFHQQPYSRLGTMENVTGPDCWSIPSSNRHGLALAALMTRHRVWRRSASLLQSLHSSAAPSSDNGRSAVTAFLAVGS